MKNIAVAFVASIALVVASTSVFAGGMSGGHSGPHPHPGGNPPPVTTPPSNPTNVHQSQSQSAYGGTGIGYGGNASAKGGNAKSNSSVWSSNKNINTNVANGGSVYGSGNSNVWVNVPKTGGGTTIVALAVVINNTEVAEGSSQQAPLYLQSGRMYCGRDVNNAKGVKCQRYIAGH